MKVQPININNQNSTSFGMALKMPPSHKMEDKVGIVLAEQAEKTRSILEEMAKEVDISVFPYQERNLPHTGFEITVSQLRQGTSHLIEKLVHRREIPAVKTVAYQWRPEYQESMADFMIRTTKNLIKQFESLTKENSLQ